MKYKRILLKLSGESLQGNQESGISSDIIVNYATRVSELASMGCEVGIVIGGGNIFRGLGGEARGFDRVKGDQMGMLATVINSIALADQIEKTGARAEVYTSIRMEPVGKLYKRDEVVRNMEGGVICIIAGGTGNPYFTTDTAAALRAVETGCDILLKGTRVDGVYSSDPEKNPDATRYDTISFDEVINKKLRIMDQTAFTLCRENNMPILVFDMDSRDNLKKIISGQKCGTLVMNS